MPRWAIWPRATRPDRVASIACSTHRVVRLDGPWRYAATTPGAADDPATLALLAPTLAWLPAPVPGTAAAALRAAGQWSLDTARDFDAEDGWWWTAFDAPATNDAETAGTGEDPVETWLRFEGLATLATVWLNGERILDSQNAFQAFDVRIHLKAQNLLQLRCAALAPALKARRPRPRWKTRLVAQQQLRWFRTSLLGRIPGWSPPVAATGPWRPVSLVEKRHVDVLEADLQSRLDDDGAGVVTARLRLRGLAPGAITHVRLQVGSATTSGQLVHADDGHLEIAATARLADAEPWWPHTHGAQPRYPVRLLLDGATGTIVLDAGLTGFRRLALNTADDGFALAVNGVPIFCRGACWTSLDIATLAGDEATLAESLDQFRASGFNLLRVGGTMVYESPRFYEACAERGILVWQDFCFANLDYPGEDAAFAASVHAEAGQFLARTQLNPALGLLCGNSEIAQQVAMLGQPPALAHSPLFGELLPGLGRLWRPDLPYVESSPSGGALPFQVDAGVSHYYGVGAYLRPLEDARRAGVRFTSECLAFANVPEPETLELVLSDGQAAPHHPRWKARVPRDSGPGWDFDDVRDHYLQQLFGLDPRVLRYTDVERYLYLSRLVSAEVMATTMSEWRRAGSRCQGALVWFWRDLWPGAGWGLVDATGLPKAPYYALKRTCAPVALLLTDEGLNGLALHGVNDRAEALGVRIELTLYRHGETPVASGTVEAHLPPRGGMSWRGDALLGRFTDLTYAYRFGPPGHQVAVARLFDAVSGEVLGQAVHIPDMSALARHGDPGLTAIATPQADGGYALDVQTQKFAYGVWIDARGYVASDNYFHLFPGATHQVTLHPRATSTRFQAWLQASTSPYPVRASVREAAADLKAPPTP